MAQGYGPRWLATRACAVIWLLATFYCLPALAASWTVEGRVVGVSDGDTITVLDRGNVQHKIRLSGIDAPEKGQAFGERAKENLSKLVFDRYVEAHCHKKDPLRPPSLQGHARLDRREYRTDQGGDGVVVSGVREGADGGGPRELRGGGR
jgi:hypothetical protein